MQPGECWVFKGSTGYLLVGLNGYVNVTHISYEHIPLSLAPDGNFDAAPQHMQIWVCVELEERCFECDFLYRAIRASTILKR